MNLKGKMEKKHNDFHEVHFSQNNLKDTKLITIRCLEHV